MAAGLEKTPVGSAHQTRSGSSFSGLGRMVGEDGMVSGVVPARVVGGWSAKLNGRYHRAALNTFMVIVIAHWAEHIAQAIQIWGLGWSRPKAKGLLGYAFP